MLLALKSINEPQPGQKWKGVFDKTWPFYKRWFLSEGHLTRPGYITSQSALRNHMPELMPIYEKLCALSGGSDIAARYLSMYCPPAYMRGCTQLAWTQNETALIRNYDYNPKLFEGVMLNTNWIQPVMGVSDCNWGLLDGMNASGLAISLTFGGNNITGVGFGIPLILRYVLETCANIKEAKAVFNRVPVHMTYNVTLVDKSGEYLTIYLSPNREPHFLQSRVATNHQETIEWQEYASFSNTIDRKKFLELELLTPDLTSKQIEKKFFEAPLYQCNLDRSFATLYTAVYQPEEGKAKIMWPNKTLFQSFSHFEEKRIVINLGKPLVDTLA